MEYLTIEEVAEELGMTIGGVYQRIAKGQVPGAVKRGKRWYIPESHLYPYINTMNVTEAARYIKDCTGSGSRQSIYNWVNEGLLTEVRDALGILRVPAREVRALVAMVRTDRRANAKKSYKLGKQRERQQH